MHHGGDISVMQDNINVEIKPENLTGITPFILATDKELVVTWASRAILKRKQQAVGMNISELIRYVAPSEKVSSRSLFRKTGELCKFLLLQDKSEIPLIGRWLDYRKGFLLLATPDAETPETLSYFSLDEFPEENHLLELLAGRDETHISLKEAASAAKILKESKQHLKSLNAALEHEIAERKQAEEQLHRTFDSLKKALGTTIQVMVSAVETRDPYTAGHQLRSADLARAIATEMGLPQEKIEAIRMAGPIHDIGKLSIPAEILSKPKKLSEIEFSLIKEHSRSGYEILKDVESPWPLAEIVYQHHERMDGSGYPRNLKGNEILMEARIMAVADVVEAMASHRPYRPSLGIDKALEEIERNRGTHYDNTVVDACLRLFREKGYQLRT